MSYMFDDENTDITMLRRKIEDMQTELDSLPVQIPGLNAVAAADTIPIAPKGTDTPPLTFDGITDALGDTWTQINDVVGQFTFDADNLVTGVQDALDSAIDAIIANIGRLADDVSTWVTELHTNAASAITGFFDDIGVGIGTALDNFSAATWTGLANFPGAVESALGATWTSLETFIGSITTSAATWLEGQGTAIETALGSAWTNLETFLGSVTSTASAWLATQGTAIETALGTAWTNLETFLGSITGTAGDWLEAQGTAIETALGTAWTNISTFVGSITSTAATWLTTQGTAIQTALGTAWTNLTTFLGGITGTATAWLEAAGTQIESALGAAYTWLKAKYTDAENTLDQIIMWFGSGTNQIASGVNTFLDAAKAALFGGLIPSAFAEEEADGQITASLASGGDIKTEIEDDITAAFVDFAVDLSSTIVTSGLGLTSLLANIAAFLTGGSSSGANKALSNLANVQINSALVFDTSSNTVGGNSTTNIGATTGGSMYFKVPNNDAFYFQENGGTQLEIREGRIKFPTVTSDPTSSEGWAWYNTDDNKFKFNEGGTVNEISGGGGLTSAAVTALTENTGLNALATGDYLVFQDASEDEIRKATAKTVVQDGLYDISYSSSYPTSETGNYRMPLIWQFSDSNGSTRLVSMNTFRNWIFNNPSVENNPQHLTDSDYILGVDGTVPQRFRIGDLKTHVFTGSGNGSNIDLGSVGESIIPSSNDSYSLGSQSRGWRNLYVENEAFFDGDVHLGGASNDLVSFFGTNGHSKLSWSVPISDYDNRTHGFSGTTTAEQLTGIRSKIVQILSDLKSYGIF